MKTNHLRQSCLAAILGTTLIVPLAAQAQSDDILLDEIVISAEEQARQALGSSTITAEDLEKQPVANDLSEIIRKMPGVNLTGTSASGQRGNNRQIDIRGMGPENTLILIDGKPVLSRNAVRMGRAGERDSRGDSNWVPAELVERIEVLRGPAAARYGSGASGGVVNIITKRPEVATASVGLHYGQPESSLEGGNMRANLLLAQPLGDRVTLRFTSSYSKSEADDPLINLGADDAMCDLDGDDIDETPCPAAGSEGVVNKDIGALLTWDVAENHSLDFEANFSRQGNEFTGDRQLGSTNETIQSVLGEETNRMLRRTLGVTHRGTYAFGESFSYLQWENTRNSRYPEGSAGSSEGAINASDAMATIELDNITAKSEWTLPLNLFGKPQTLTLGAEFRGEYMEDGVSIRQASEAGGEPVVIPGTGDADSRDPEIDQTTLSFYVEDNIQWTDRLIVTPGLRIDHNSNFGANLSPSLNATYAFTDEWSMKVGVARAFKSPNLYQLNPNYVYYTMGNGCPLGWTNGDNAGQSGCFVVGNPDLDPETSVNKEIGVAYEGFNGVSASVTAFHNDYKDRISSGIVPIGTADSADPDVYGRLFQWENVPEAVVSGLEGSFSTPLTDAFMLTTNATYMIESKNKQNDQPLSLVPDYTINAALDWYATDAMTVTTSVTHYGKTPSPTLTATTGNELEVIEDRPAYTLVNLGMTYEFDAGARVSAGVTNLFDKQILREGSGNSAGANTYNEPGRAFYVSLNKTF